MGWVLKLLRKDMKEYLEYRRVKEILLNKIKNKLSKDETI